MFEALKGYVDSSDPDISLPNKEHMMQTAEVSLCMRRRRRRALPLTLTPTPTITLRRSCYRRSARTGTRSGFSWWG